MRPTTMRAKTWAPIVTFVAVAAIGATVALVSTRGGGGDPQPLGLTSGSARDSRLVAPATAGGSGNGYKLTGTLSNETPPDAPVWNLAGGTPSEELVTRLAKALKAGTPVRDGKGWRAGGLVVSGEPGMPWYWYECGGAKDTAVSSDGSVTSGACVASGPVPLSVPGASGSGSAGTGGSAPTTTTVVPGPTAPPAAEPDVSEAVVKDGAQEVLAALGYDVAGARIDTSPYGGSATVEPTVGGLATSGFTTRVDVDGARRITGASGFLGTASRGDSYPLVSAKSAFDAMPQLARPDLCQLPPDGSQGCVEPPPVEITGATLGLSLQQTQDGDLLVPSWLYSVEGGQRIAAVAVQEKYQRPVQQPVDTPGSANAGTAVPPAPAREQVGIDSAKAGPGNAVIATYDGGGCGHDDVMLQAKEDATTVYLVLEAAAQPKGQACTEEYAPRTATVQLQAPLGNRTLIDASTGKPVSTG